MTYRVIAAFTDGQDNDHAYGVGDIFPRSGVVVSEDRINVLRTAENGLGYPLIEESPEKEEKPVRSEIPATEEAPKKRGGRKRAD